jgi:hypothetical protein
MSHTPQAPEDLVSHMTSKDDFCGKVEVKKQAFPPSPLTEILLPPDPSGTETLRISVFAITRMPGPAIPQPDISKSVSQMARSSELRNGISSLIQLGLGVHVKWNHPPIRTASCTSIILESGKSEERCHDG